MVEEALLMEQHVEFRELGLRARLLNGLGLDSQAPQFVDLPAHEISASSERDGFEQRLQTVALALLHLLQFLRIGKVWRRLANEILRPRESVFEPPCAVLKRTAHGVGARGEPTLVE